MTNAKNTKMDGTNVETTKGEKAMTIDLTNLTDEQKTQLKEQFRNEFTQEQKEAYAKYINKQFQALKSLAFRGYVDAKDKTNFDIDTGYNFADKVQNWYKCSKAFNIILKTEYEDENGKTRHVYTIQNMDILAKGKSKAGKSFSIFAPSMPAYES